MAMKWDKVRILPYEKDDSTIYDLWGRGETKIIPTFLNYWDYFGIFNELLDTI